MPDELTQLSLAEQSSAKDKGLTQSSLLSTADPEWSMAELFNREPLELYQQHPEQFKRLILELRAQAERNRAAEDSGKRIPRAAKMADALPTKTLLSAEEMLFGTKEK